MEQYRISDELYDELKLYREMCHSALKSTVDKIESIHRLLEATGEESPFSKIDSRLKEIESILKKCEHKCQKGEIQSLTSIDDIKNHIFDIAGIRIITTFRDEIYEVEKLIRKAPGINIVNKKDYIKEPKKSGYQSLHLGCQVEIWTPEGTELIPIEIQIRDVSMDLWASVEHKIRYKKDEDEYDPKTDEYFHHLVQLMTEFSESAIEFRDYSKSDSKSRNEPAKPEEKPKKSIFSKKP